MHLVTHGFFKAGLFLGAGSVMHGMNDDVNMRHYGGLRKYMPMDLRHLRARLPGDHRLSPFSGYFSKDKIIEAAFARAARPAGSSAASPCSAPG
jgi:NADH-quinone oxidoreductase subunit L